MQDGTHFISGLPRSGSTLLAAILRQNPRFHPSSPPNPGPTWHLLAEWQRPTPSDVVTGSAERRVAGREQRRWELRLRHIYLRRSIALSCRWGARQTVGVEPPSMRNVVPVIKVAKRACDEANGSSDIHRLAEAVDRLMDDVL
jgi:hypothetical protein